MVNRDQLRQNAEQLGPESRMKPEKGHEWYVIMCSWGAGTEQHNAAITKFEEVYNHLKVLHRSSSVSPSGSLGNFHRDSFKALFLSF